MAFVNAMKITVMKTYLNVTVCNEFSLDLFLNIFIFMFWFLLIFMYLCLSTAYSFVTGFLFYNFNNTIEMSSEVQNGNYNITHFFNVEGMKDSEDNFFKLISKYRHRLPLLNRNAFNASKEAVVSAFFKTDPNNVQRDLLFKYCTGGSVGRE